MKEQVETLVNDSISSLNVFVDAAYFEEVEGKKILNIVLDSKEVIDLKKITEASRVINKIIDENNSLLEDADELDIFSKEKGREE